eukprot:TRINITY_DN8461_c0_g1_i1.p1 TRINITY_DN8461_c0_g1~~TRINITY_DN8461_c0_g1_i1.p1  ORF type:complete len:391 (+),score=154.42 TRINITY_DN8461_c0_g1_i1:93-1265(+)
MLSRVSRSLKPNVRAMASQKDVALKMQTPVNLGDLKLKNRVVLSSLTRNRAIGTIPNDYLTTYYSQRASAGLLLTECTLIEPQGTEWPSAPGIWSRRQIAAWKRVTDAVHAAGGSIVCQLYHGGRVVHTLHNCGQLPVAPSAVAARGGRFRLLKGTEAQPDPSYVTPEAIEDPKEYVEMFRKAAQNARDAGFDGVELHGATGYLPNQFLDPVANQRTDQYGGSVENRCRFVLECVDALSSVWGSSRVGIKLSPGGGYNDTGESLEGLKATFSHLISKLDERNLAYLQLLRYIPAFDFLKRGSDFDIEMFRPLFRGKMMVNGDLSRDSAEDMLQKGVADAVAFGRAFIANPDLPARLFNNYPLANPEFQYFYYGEGDNHGRGYTDYPTYKS